MVFVAKARNLRIYRRTLLTLNRSNNRVEGNGPTRVTQSNKLTGVLIVLAMLFTFALAVGWGVAQASDPRSLLAPGAQVPDGPPTVALPPQAAPSGVPASLPTGEAPGNPSSPSDAPGGSTTTPPGSSGGFPWLPVAVLAVVAALGAALFLMMRSRNTTVTATGPVVPPDASRTRPMATLPSVPPPPPAAVMSAGAAPVTTLTCPNCNATNDWNENFCHDCGQDLRRVRAALVAAAPPTDVVTDDMPYLETLDRANDQLEYVLSRPRIVIGAAAGCDILVDSSFAGSATVAPRHAQLLRNDTTTFLVTDLGAPAGTFVNNTRIEANSTVPLKNGDQIRVGDVRFVYRVP